MVKESTNEKWVMSKEVYDRPMVGGEGGGLAVTVGCPILRRLDEVWFQ